MASGEQLWKLSQSRLRTVKILLEAADLDAAAYMMGYALETALKAATCRTLHLSEYPESVGNKTTKTYFMTHKFDQLLTVSGFTDVFEASGPPETSSKWSEFLQFYPGDWITMRYDPNTIIKFNSITVSKLYEILYAGEGSIIKTVEETQQW